MSSLSVWTAFVLVASALGLIACFFSLRVLRVAAALVALAAAAYLTWYGLTYPAKAPGLPGAHQAKAPGLSSAHQAKAPSLSGAFTRGTDVLIHAFFHLQLVPSGPHLPGPGWIGWLIIAVLLVIGYRELEALSQHCHARYLDTSELARAQQTDSSGGEGALTDGQRHDRRAARLTGALTDGQRHDRLAAGLKFWLPAVDVRAPAILPGGSRSSALASIAEASGVNGSGLAGAIIRFFGMLWPSPRRVRVRVWVKGAAVPRRVDAQACVAVNLDNPGTGASFGTKTLAADSLDHAACAAAGYVARSIFEGDPTVPPWCIGVADGGDLAAMLLARHERVYPETEEEINTARRTKIGFLDKVAFSSQCAGVARYELAHLYDLTDQHVKALLLHANNREQYKRFYRGRYRLAMSLEMIASSDPCTKMLEEEQATLGDVLRILLRWDGKSAYISEKYLKEGKLVLDTWLGFYLLKAAQEELQEIGRYLTLWDVIWHSFWHRKERGVLKPYWRPRHRQSFHDGVRLAQLLVAVRQKLNNKQEAYPPPPPQRALTRLSVAVRQTLKDQQEAAPPPRPRRVLTGLFAAARQALNGPIPHSQRVLRIATTIADDSTEIADLLGIPYKLGKPWRKERPPRRVERLRTRCWRWQYRSPSWPAAYNLACVYAAIYAYHNHRLEASAENSGDEQVNDKTDEIGEKLKCLARKVVTSLEFAINNPDSEMERPSEWIAHDPDFACLHSPGGEFSKDFTEFLETQKQRDYPPSTAAESSAGHRTAW